MTDTLNHDEHLKREIGEEIEIDIYEELDKIQRQSGRGLYHGPNDAVVDQLYGFNRWSQGASVSGNKDIQGHIFFTRPDLNLSRINLTAVREFTPLLTENSLTYQRAIRILLDPIYGMTHTDNTLVDARQAFMSVLTNACISCTGWPDEALNITASDAGIAKEVHIMNDSISEVHGMFSLNCEFQSMQGALLLTLFRLWIKYIGNVYIGKQYPRINNLHENRIDYMTRVYRIILDPTGRYVSHIAIANAGIPTGINSGTFANYDRSLINNEEMNRVSVGLSCTGFYMDDPILMQEFNRTVEMFNRNMADDRRKTFFRKLEGDEFRSLNYVGYPHIDEDTMEFAWWVPKDFKLKIE